jgi:hypothetical protein
LQWHVSVPQLPHAFCCPSLQTDEGCVHVPQAKLVLHVWDPPQLSDPTVHGWLVPGAHWHVPVASHDPHVLLGVHVCVPGQPKAAVTHGCV